MSEKLRLDATASLYAVTAAPSPPRYSSPASLQPSTLPSPARVLDVCKNPHACLQCDYVIFKQYGITVNDNIWGCFKSKRLIFLKVTTSLSKIFFKKNFVATKITRSFHSNFVAGTLYIHALVKFVL